MNERRLSAMSKCSSITFLLALVLSILASQACAINLRGRELAQEDVAAPSAGVPDEPAADGGASSPPVDGAAPAAAPAADVGVNPTQDPAAAAAASEAGQASEEAPADGAATTATPAAAEAAPAAQTGEVATDTTQQDSAAVQPPSAGQPAGKDM